MIEITGLTFTYPHGRQPALSDVGLRIGAGELVLLTGASGSGKSTLLRCLNGLVPHMSGGVIGGRVRVADLDPIAAGPRRLSQRVGFVFQNPEEQGVLDRVAAEIAFGLEHSLAFRETIGGDRRAQRAALAARVGDVMARLGLEGLADRPLHTLSGGERQKVALAGALVLRPAVLLLDEPTSQLDPRAAADLLDHLLRLNHDENITVILAEHRLERVLPFVTRLVHLEEGRVAFDMPPGEGARRIPDPPPLIQVGLWRGWNPLPLSVEAARPLAAKDPPPPAGRPALPAARDNVLLGVRGLTAGYAGRMVLDGIDLVVGPGEALALLGTNGTGKTTLLKCVTGLLPIRRGDIQVGGRSVKGRETAAICREVAYLPQNPDDLLFADTAAEELRLTLANHGLPVRPEVVDGALGSLGLAEVGERYPRDLSIGQRQRVALGAVTVPGQPLILLDEPTRGLDPAAKERLLAQWRMWLAAGRGLLLATHDVELAVRIAGRVAILERGRVAACGPAAEVLDGHPSFAPQLARLWPGRGILAPEDVSGPPA